MIEPQNESDQSSRSRHIYTLGELQAYIERASLPKYEAACRAIAEAKSVDEVKSIRDQASAMAACAHQAGNKQLEVDAAEMARLPPHDQRSIRWRPY